jgi:hypothetical protein
VTSSIEEDEFFLDVLEEGEVVGVRGHEDRASCEPLYSAAFSVELWLGEEKFTEAVLDFVWLGRVAEHYSFSFKPGHLVLLVCKFLSTFFLGHYLESLFSSICVVCFL